MGTATAKVHKRVDIRRNDTVKVMTGRDEGKEGRVLRVFPDEMKVLVEHVMMVKKHVRPNPQRNVKGGIAEQERRISLSNVALVCGAYSGAIRNQQGTGATGTDLGDQQKMKRAAGTKAAAIGWSR